MVTATTTTERVAAGWYRVYDENGYLLCTIRRAVGDWWAETTSKPWYVRYQGGGSGGSFKTLKAAKAKVEERWTENE
jgi:hypothetical protein